MTQAIKKMLFFLTLGLLFILFVLFFKIFFLNNFNTTKENKKNVATEYNLKHNGLNRRYLVHLPQNYTDKKEVPVVLIFHGGGSNAESALKYNLNAKSNQEGFITVYPEGTGKSALGNFYGTWNAGRCCGQARNNKIDDVGFIKILLQELDKNFNIDNNRIYATGFSNGAQMTYRLACELSDKIAAIAPGGSVGSFESCNLSRPVPVLAFGGTNDPCTPYDGAENCGGCITDFFREIGLPVQYDYYKCEGTDNHIKKWKNLNGCTDNYSVVYQKNNTTCLSHSECNDNSEIVLCTIEGGGHTWPGINKYTSNSCDLNPNGKICSAWKKAVGPLTPDFQINDFIWDFFKKHPLK